MLRSNIAGQTIRSSDCRHSPLLVSGQVSLILAAGSPASEAGLTSGLSRLVQGLRSRASFGLPTTIGVLACFNPCGLIEPPSATSRATLTILKLGVQMSTYQQRDRLDREFLQWGSNFMLPFDRDDVPE
jgi:hypothetical protein